MFPKRKQGKKCDVPTGALKIGVEDKNAIAIIAYLFREWAEMIKASHKRARKKRTRVSTMVTPAE